MTDGPKKISTEPTLVMDIEKALSERARAAIDRARESYPDLPIGDDVSITEASPDELAEMLRSQRQTSETLVECPRCSGCSGCHGERMVTPVRAAEIKAEMEEP